MPLVELENEAMSRAGRYARPSNDRRPFPIRAGDCRTAQARDSRCATCAANTPAARINQEFRKVGIRPNRSRGLMTTKRRKTTRSATPRSRRRPATAKVVRARSSDAGDLTSKPMFIGYARVSTADQNLALQRDALTEAGCQKIFTEQMSGAVADRPALHDALEFARSGDTLIVWKLDRLARSMKAVDRNRRKPARERHRLSEPDRGSRHNDRTGATCFSHV